MPQTKKVKRYVDSKRFLMILSVALCVLFGVLPTWWYTTSVYRTNLPHAQIEKLQPLQKKSHCYLPINLHFIFLNQDWRQKVLLPKTIQQYTCPINIEETYITPDLRQEFHKNMERMRDQDFDEYIQNQIQIEYEDLYNTPGSYLIIIDEDADAPEIVFGKYRHAWVRLTKWDTKTYEELVSTIFHVYSFQVGEKSEVQFSSSLNYRISFTLLNADPESHIVSWDFDKLQTLYIQPFLNKLSSIATFSVDSQIIHHGVLPSEPRFIKQTNTFQIAANSIQYLLNNNDWKFESPAFIEPTIQFLLFVPSARHTPLRILTYEGKESKYNSFIIPQWGGVAIYNIENATEKVISLTDKELHSTMEVFIEQLRLLLGVASNEKWVKTWRTKYVVSNDGICEWEIDGLRRMRSAEYIKSAMNSLISLSKIANEMPNVNILQPVAKHALLSLQSIQKVTNNASDYMSTMKDAQLAFHHSESAFFHESMISQIYFPDSQKLAIYLPLFLPLVVTIVTAFKKEIQRIKAKNVQNSS